MAFSSGIRISTHHIVIVLSSLQTPVVRFGDDDDDDDNDDNVRVVDVVVTDDDETVNCAVALVADLRPFTLQPKFAEGWCGMSGGMGGITAVAAKVVGAAVVVVVGCDIAAAFDVCDAVVVVSLMIE